LSRRSKDVVGVFLDRPEQAVVLAVATPTSTHNVDTPTPCS